MGSIATKIAGSTSAFVLTAPLQALRRLFANRRTIHALAALDDRQLADIGLTRLDVEWASLLPANADAIAELDALARGARRRRFESRELG